MPGAVAFGCVIAAHGLVAVALAISYGHNHRVSDVLVCAAAPAVGAGLWATRRPARSGPGEAWIAWVAALASTLATAVLDPGTFVQPGAPQAPFLVMTVAAIGIVASYALDALGPRAPPAPASLPLRLSWLPRARPAALVVIAFGLGVW